MDHDVHVASSSPQTISNAATKPIRASARPRVTDDSPRRTQPRTPSSSEEPSDLVAAGPGDRLTLRVADPASLFDVAELLRQRVPARSAPRWPGLHTRGGRRSQAGAGSDRGPRVDCQRRASRRPGFEPADPRSIDSQRPGRRSRKLMGRASHASVRIIGLPVAPSSAAVSAASTTLIRVVQSARRGVDDPGIEVPERRSGLRGEHSSALDRHCADLHDHVPRSGASRGDEPAGRRHAQHICRHDDRLSAASGHLGV